MDDVLVDIHYPLPGGSCLVGYVRHAEFGKSKTE
jgi:hypothetical protein